MRYFKLLILLSVAFFAVACNKKPAGKKPAAKSSFEEKAKNPLEEQINKITNTVLLEPLLDLRDDSSFYQEKQYLVTALDNSTQKDIFFSCEEFKKNLKMLIHATNLGDSRSIITYPALTTHRQLSDKQLEACGVTNDFMRLSVGLEDADDIIEDIDFALSKV